MCRVVVIVARVDAFYDYKCAYVFVKLCLMRVCVSYKNECILKIQKLCCSFKTTLKWKCVVSGMCLVAGTCSTRRLCRAGRS